MIFNASSSLKYLIFLGISLIYFIDMMMPHILTFILSLQILKAMAAESHYITLGKISLKKQERKLK
jgi:hypothetical protein